MIKFWYPKRQRYDVFVDGARIDALNSYTNDAGKYDLLAADDHYIPDPATATHGDNFYDPRTGHLYIAITGDVEDPVIDVQQVPVVVFEFGGTVSNEDFFDVNPIQNIAALLGIDPR